MDEYSRILTNPTNFMMSDELKGRIEGTPEDNTVLARLFIGDQSYTCKLISYSRTVQSIKITLNVGNLDFSHLLKAESVGCEICGEWFEFGSS